MKRCLVHNQRSVAQLPKSSQLSAKPHRNLRLKVVGAVKKDTAKYVVCSKTMVVKKEFAQQALEMCQDVTQVFQTKLSVRKNGVLAFDCVQDRWEENVFHFYERYDNAIVCGQHIATGDFKSFMEKVEPFLEKPIGMTLYEYDNGQLGASAMSQGPKGEGGLDDATGASGAASASSMKQTSATIDLTQVMDDEEEEDAFRKDLGKVTKDLGNVTKGLQNIFQNVFAGLGGKK